MKKLLKSETEKLNKINPLSLPKLTNTPFNKSQFEMLRISSVPFIKREKSGEFLSPGMYVYVYICI
jgi:hypothetical protein